MMVLADARGCAVAKMDNNRVPDVMARMEAVERARAFAEPVLKAENEMRRGRALALAAFDHKNEGTPETHAHAARTRQGALARLFESGAIDKDQLAWACEIAMVAEGIERDVAVRVVSYEPRIDHETHGGIVLALEGVMRVRREMAYGRWRRMLPMPKRLVLDMIVGEPIGFSMAARRYGIRHQRAKSILIAAIDRWPDCIEWACKRVDADDVAAAHTMAMR